MSCHGWPSVLLPVALAFAVVFACHERAPTRFPHELHLTGLSCGKPGQGACLTCTSCHRDPEVSLPQTPTAVEPEPSSAERPGPKRPDVTTCSPCHRDDAEALAARSFRPPLEPAPTAYQIHFDHQRHLQMRGIRGQCVPCHSGVVRQESSLFPPMDRCFECHEHQQQFDRGQCGPCHDALEVKQLVPRTFVRHDRSFLTLHGSEAQRQPRVCQSCHSQQQCDDCHDMTQTSLVEQRHPEAFERQWTHPADFISRHALEARSQPGRCLTCHKPQTCDGCHLERGVSGIGIDARSPHPPGWVGGNPASRDFHGRAARRDLASCAACHDHGPATNCIDCHRVGGSGGNPHPRGNWTSRSSSAEMCRYCHVR